MTVQEKLEAYNKRKEYYESCYSPRKYWVIYASDTRKKIKETSRGWEVAEYKPEKIIVRHINYNQVCLDSV